MKLSQKLVFGIWLVGLLVLIYNFFGFYLPAEIPIIFWRILAALVVLFSLVAIILVFLKTWMGWRKFENSTIPQYQIIIILGAWLAAILLLIYNLYVNYFYSLPGGTTLINPKALIIYGIPILIQIILGGLSWKHWKETNKKSTLLISLIIPIALVIIGLLMMLVFYTVGY